MSGLTEGRWGSRVHGLLQSRASKGIPVPHLSLLPSLAPHPRPPSSTPFLGSVSCTDRRQEAHVLQVSTAQASGGMSLMCFILGHPRTRTSPLNHKVTAPAFLMETVSLEHRGDFQAERMPSHGQQAQLNPGNQHGCDPPLSSAFLMRVPSKEGESPVSELPKRHLRMSTQLPTASSREDSSDGRHICRVHADTHACLCHLHRPCHLSPLAVARQREVLLGLM